MGDKRLNVARNGTATEARDVDERRALALALSGRSKEIARFVQTLRSNMNRAHYPPQAVAFIDDVRATCWRSCSTSSLSERSVVDGTFGLDRHNEPFPPHSGAW